MAAFEESNSQTVIMSELLKESKIEVGNLFKKLTSWSKEREESQKQFSDMVLTYNTNITEGINDMAKGLKGFCDMQAQLSAVRNERDNLLAMVNNLNDEVKDLSDKLVTCYKSMQGLGVNHEHDVDNLAGSGKGADKTSVTEQETKVLEEFFEMNAYPKNEDLEYLSKQLNLSYRIIVVWFQNARQKMRNITGNKPPLNSQYNLQGPGENHEESVNNEAGSAKRTKRNRLTKHQMKLLQEFFKMNRYPKHGDIEYLSEQLNLSCKVIMVWFSNARQRMKNVTQDQPPVDPQYEMQDEPHQQDGNDTDMENLGTEHDINLETPTTSSIGDKAGSGESSSISEGPGVDAVNKVQGSHFKKLLMGNARRKGLQNPKQSPRPSVPSETATALNAEDEPTQHRSKI